MKRFVGKVWRAIPHLLRRIVTRATQTNFTVSAAAVVFDGAGRVLLLDHVLRDGVGWGIIGGYLNAGEQPADALRRELREEADIAVKDLHLIFFYTEGQHLDIVYRCEIESGEPKANSREIIEARWFEPEKLPTEIDGTQRRLINLARQASSEKTIEPLFGGN